MNQNKLLYNIVKIAANETADKRYNAQPIADSRFLMDFTPDVVTGTVAARVADKAVGKPLSKAVSSAYSNNAGLTGRPFIKLMEDQVNDSTKKFMSKIRNPKNYGFNRPFTDYGLEFGYHGDYKYYTHKDVYRDLVDVDLARRSAQKRNQLDKYKQYNKEYQNLNKLRRNIERDAQKQVDRKLANKYRLRKLLGATSRSIPGVAAAAPFALDAYNAAKEKVNAVAEGRRKKQQTQQVQQPKK